MRLTARVVIVVVGPKSTEAGIGLVVIVGAEAPKTTAERHFAVDTAVARVVKLR